jgi:hypothetical protein
VDLMMDALAARSESINLHSRAVRAKEMMISQRAVQG